ncbi:MAG: hypothetical protein ACI8Y4_005447 [Candidatus Poriferisodalaceae bacterium]|jgi:hypothetical protein
MSKGNRGLRFAPLVVGGALVLASIGAHPAGAQEAPAQASGCAANAASSGGQLVSWHQVSVVNVTIPAGTYSVSGVSSDPTHVPGEALDQVSERWSFATSDGQTSSITADIPHDVTNIDVIFGTMTFASDVSSITFNHHGDGNSADSVYANLTFACIPEVTTTTAAPTTAAPTTTAPTTAAPTTAAPTTAAPTTAPAGGSDVGSKIVDNNTPRETLPRTGRGGGVLWAGVALLIVGFFTTGLSQRIIPLVVGRTPSVFDVRDEPRD